MTDPVVFFVPGIPAPQGSKDQFGRESSKRLPAWRGTIATEARAARTGGLLDEPVRVRCMFVFPRPKKHYRRNGELTDKAPWWHSQRPDVDKLARAILDGITGVVIRDDGLVAQLVASKTYGDEPGAKVWVHPVAPEGDA